MADLSLSSIFHPWAFLIGIVIGLIYMTLMVPKPRVVIKHPTPLNAGTITYQDEAGVCYRYRAIPVDCDGSEEPIPLQGFKPTQGSKAAPKEKHQPVFSWTAS